MKYAGAGKSEIFVKDYIQDKINKDIEKCKTSTNKVTCHIGDFQIFKDVSGGSGYYGWCEVDILIENEDGTKYSLFGQGRMPEEITNDKSRKKEVYE